MAIIYSNHLLRVYIYETKKKKFLDSYKNSLVNMIIDTDNLFQFTRWRCNITLFYHEPTSSCMLVIYTGCWLDDVQQLVCCIYTRKAKPHQPMTLLLLVTLAVADTWNTVIIAQRSESKFLRLQYRDPSGFVLQNLQPNKFIPRMLQKNTN
jgi:hypothetical protein